MSSTSTVQVDKKLQEKTLFQLACEGCGTNQNPSNVPLVFRNRSKKLTKSQAQMVLDRLSFVQSGINSRCIAFNQIIQMVESNHSIIFINGGTVPNAYKYRAMTTVVMVCSYKEFGKWTIAIWIDRVTANGNRCSLNFGSRNQRSWKNSDVVGFVRENTNFQVDISNLVYDVDCQAFLEGIKKTNPGKERELASLVLADWLEAYQDFFAADYIRFMYTHKDFIFWVQNQIIRVRGK